MDVTGHAKTSVRASYGTYTDRLFQLVFSAQGGLVNNPPFAQASNAPNVPFTLGIAVPVNTSTLSIFGLDPKLKNQILHRVSAGLEHQCIPDLNVTADYVGSFGRDLFGVADLNGAGGVPLASRPDTRFSTTRVIDNYSKSDYHSLQVAALQQPRKGRLLYRCLHVGLFEGRQLGRHLLHLSWARQHGSIVCDRLPGRWPQWLG